MKKLLLFLLLIIPINVHAIYTNATSSILMDMDSGRILYQNNKDEQRLVASISKIMTAVVTIENSNLDDDVKVGNKVLNMYGSSIYVQPGEVLKLRDLIYGLLLRSGNDAAVVIAKHVGGTEEKFVELMNKKAKAIGMKNTIYKNPHGLDEETKNYSTAYDMALLTKYANTLNEYKKISSTKRWIVSTGKKTYDWYNRNKLLYKYKYTTGGKTGYTPKAGKTLVTTAAKDNLTLGVVTLNDSDEYIDHEKLYEYGFNNYKKYLIIDKDSFNIDNSFYKDKVYVKESFSYPLTEKEKEYVKVLAKIYKVKKYKNNDEVGEIIVTLKDEEIYKEKIYVSINKKMSIIERIKNIFK